MELLVALVVAIVLFSGFLLLTAREMHTGQRLFGVWRGAVDDKLSALLELREKVSFRVIALHFVQSITRRFMHEVLSVSLAALKVIERALLRIGSYMHSHALSAPSLHAKTHVSEALTHLKRTLAKEDEKNTKVE